MTSAADPHNLERFLRAQHDVHRQALTELRSGRKRSHWMWFVFPQFAGLGSSPTSEHFAIRSLEEAREYVRHPVLGPRLLECVEALLSLAGHSAREIFGSPDDLKLRSSMTLFELANPDEVRFGAVLDEFFAGERDGRTSALLKG